MNKIIKALLEAKYPTVNVEAILQVVNATPNAEIATEILCGLYERPQISSTPLNERSDEVNSQFKSFDDIKQEVTYTYNKVESKTVWIKKGSEKPKFEDKDTLSAYWAEDAAKKIGMELKQFQEEYEKIVLKSAPSEKVYTSTTALPNWQ